jgi:hypothetical protein
MLVSNISSGVKNAGKTERKKTSGGGFSAYLSGAGGAEETQAPVSASSVGGVNSLFMLQEVEDDGGAAKKAVQYGNDILGRLEDIRIGLLLGELSQDSLKNLEDRVKSWRENLTDPKLQSIVDEIELRAAVELAKLGE